jgi:hypothetical protein
MSHDLGKGVAIAAKTGAHQFRVVGIRAAHRSVGLHYTYRWSKGHQM